LIRRLNEVGADELLVVERSVPEVPGGPWGALRIEDLLSAEQFERDFAALAPRLRAVLHLGACTDTLRADLEVLENNFGFGRRLLDRCQAHGVPLIYASSAAVYGDGGEGFAEDGHAASPLNVYALSKLLLDVWARRRADAGPGHRGQIVGLRYFNVYGPGEAPKGRMASMVSQLIDQAERDGEMRLFEG